MEGTGNVSDTFEHSSMERAAYNAEMRTAFIPLMVIITLESSFGIVGNSMVFYVFLRRYKKCNFKYFALFLCAIDLSGCLTSMPLDIVLRYYYFDVPGRVFCKIKFFFLLSILLAETFMLLIICIDRYRKICHPLHWQISNKAAFRLCIFAIVLSIFTASVVTSIITGKHKDTVTYSNVTIVVTQCGSDQKYKDTPVSGISILIECTIIVGILIVMISLYILVARQLFRTKAAFDSNKNAEKTQSSFFETNVAPARRKSIIAISLTFVFMVTIILHSVFIFLLASQSLKDLTKIEWGVYTFLYTTYMVNYCINPVIYGCLDHQFAKFLRDLRNRITGDREVGSSGTDNKAGGSTYDWSKSEDNLNG